MRPISMANVNIPNYFTYTSNHPQVPNHSAGGGTAILIHKRYTQHTITVLTTSLEYTTVHIQVNNTVLHLITAYKRPVNILLPSDLTALLDTPYNTIITGDLNCKHQLWFCRRLNVARNILAHFINFRNNLFVASPNTPTHYPNNSNYSPDILDIAIIKPTISPITSKIYHQTSLRIILQSSLNYTLPRHP